MKILQRKNFRNYGKIKVKTVYTVDFDTDELIKIALVQLIKN